MEDAIRELLAKEKALEVLRLVSYAERYRQGDATKLIVFNNTMNPIEATRRYFADH